MTEQEFLQKLKDDTETAERAYEVLLHEKLISDSVLSAFRSRRAEGDPADCWEWLGSKNPSGYGVFTVGKVIVPAHRAAWIIENGPLKTSLVMCHKCDNPPCCNPLHLFAGTQADNMRDKMFKGRHYTGNKIFKLQLTPEHVREMRAGDLGATAYARLHKLPYGVVHQAMYGWTYRHLNEESPPKASKRKPRPKNVGEADQMLYDLQGIAAEQRSAINDDRPTFRLIKNP